MTPPVLRRAFDIQGKQITTKIRNTTADTGGAVIIEVISKTGLATSVKDYIRNISKRLGNTKCYPNTSGIMCIAESKPLASDDIEWLYFEIETTIKSLSTFWGETVPETNTDILVKNILTIIKTSEYNDISYLKTLLVDIGKVEGISTIDKDYLKSEISNRIKQLIGLSEPARIEQVITPKRTRLDVLNELLNAPVGVKKSTLLKEYRAL